MGQFFSLRQNHADFDRHSHGDVIAKLKIETSKKRDPFFDPIVTFLAYRCSVAFLSRYFNDVEPLAFILNQVRYLETYSAPLRILARMQDHGLLPEDIRLVAEQRIHELATETYSCKFMDDSLACLLTDETKEALYNEVKDVVLSNDFEIITEKRSEWDGESDPEDLFSTVRETLEWISEYGDEIETRRARSFLWDISTAIDELERRRPESAGYQSLDTENAAEDEQPRARSIFDDVDE